MTHVLPPEGGNKATGPLLKSGMQVSAEQSWQAYSDGVLCDHGACGHVHEVMEQSDGKWYIGACKLCSCEHRYGELAHGKAAFSDQSPPPTLREALEGCGRYIDGVWHVFECGGYESWIECRPECTRARAALAAPLPSSLAEWVAEAQGHIAQIRAAWNPDVLDSEFALLLHMNLTGLADDLDALPTLIQSYWANEEQDMPSSGDQS